jgi:uncharacterized protein YdaU (DUF1376 family)
VSKVDITRFDFHALRFLKSEDVEIMTAEEVGQFLLLMIHAWLGGKAASLPNNPTLLAKYARCKQVSEAVMREWKEGPDGRLYNETLSEEWDAAVGRSAHGMRGAAARWNKDKSTGNAQGNAPAMPEHSPSIAPPFENPMPKPYQAVPNQSKTLSSEPVGSDEGVPKPPSRKKTPATSPEGFDEFWKLYPRKEAKPRALRAWRKVEPAELPAILAGLRVHIQKEQWQKGDVKYIPLPATWLNDRRWEDENVAAKQEPIPMAPRRSENLQRDEARPLLPPMPPLPCK